MKKIKLTQGQVTLVDDADYPELAKHRWYAFKCKNTWYAPRWDGQAQKLLLMHRQIMQAQPGQEIDHINSNGLDNRRSNLRFATRTQNHANRRISRKNTSGAKGVYWDKSRKKWYAYINLNGKRHFLGRFKNLEAAAQAYNTTAHELFGSYARLNKMSLAIFKD